MQPDREMATSLRGIFSKCRLRSSQFAAQPEILTRILHLPQSKQTSALFPDRGKTLHYRRVVVGVLNSPFIFYRRSSGTRGALCNVASRSLLMHNFINGLWIFAYQWASWLDHTVSGCVWWNGCCSHGERLNCWHTVSWIFQSFSLELGSPWIT